MSLQNNELTWKTFKDYLNSKTKNEIIKNDTIYGHFYQFGAGTVLNDAISKKVNSYLHKLKKTGNIVNVSRGAIMIVSEIPEDLKST